ncbi:MAG: hypothetical protein AAGF57_17720 [Pseudomonadota bacterium]
MSKWVFVVILGLSPYSLAAENCVDVLGTYLTTKTDTSGVDKGMVGRTILSLAPAGFATMTDSAQDGVQGYQAFGMMQGSWSCSQGADGITSVAVTLLDFSYPNEARPNAKVALIEITGAISAKSGGISGNTRVKLYPIEEDPFAGTKPALDVGYTFNGLRLPKP